MPGKKEERVKRVKVAPNRSSISVKQGSRLGGKFICCIFRSCLFALKNQLVNFIVHKLPPLFTIQTECCPFADKQDCMDKEPMFRLLVNKLSRSRVCICTPKVRFWHSRTQLERCSFVPFELIIYDQADTILSVVLNNISIFCSNFLLSGTLLFQKPSAFVLKQIDLFPANPYRVPHAQAAAASRASPGVGDGFSGNLLYSQRVPEP